VPGAVRDSPYVLDGLLEQQTSLRPTQLMTDTAGYSDIIFALFWLLGYQFSPRLADLGETRFWRLDPAVNYGPLNGRPTAVNRAKSLSGALSLARGRWSRYRFGPLSCWAILGC
jgi:TnpA family transposase